MCCFYWKNYLRRDFRVRSAEVKPEFLKLIEQLQPKAEYLCLFREIVLDVWKDSQKETIKLVSALASRVTELKVRCQKLIEAFGYQHSIDKTVYQEQLKLIEDEIALRSLMCTIRS